MGGCEIYKEERDVLDEEMMITDEWDAEKFRTLESSAKKIVILGDRRWPQTVRQERGTMII